MEYDHFRSNPPYPTSRVPPTSLLYIGLQVQGLYRGSRYIGVRVEGSGHARDLREAWFGVRVLGLGSRVSGLGSRVAGLGSRVSS